IVFCLGWEGFLCCLSSRDCSGVGAVLDLHCLGLVFCFTPMVRCVMNDKARGKQVVAIDENITQKECPQNAELGRGKREKKASWKARAAQGVIIG
ncbi:hypothetical protein A2U01_0026390, partial [Trifolium medium]|nr:hypothetical protein [Trifolium medium]